MNEMKNYNQNGFDKYRENIWDNIEKICRKSTLIQQCNMQKIKDWYQNKIPLHLRYPQ